MTDAAWSDAAGSGFGQDGQGAGATGGGAKTDGGSAPNDGRIEAPDDARAWSPNDAAAVADGNQTLPIVRPAVTTPRPPSGAPYFYTTAGWSAGVVSLFHVAADGMLSKVPGGDLASALPSLSFLLAEPGLQFVYATSERAIGSVVAFKVDAATGKLSDLGAQDSGGKNPVHLAVTPNGRWIFAAHFVSGDVTALPVQVDGSLGRSPTPPRRCETAHGVTVHPNGRFVYGMCTFVQAPGKVAVWSFDDATGALDPQGTFPMPEHPHHMAFGHDARFAYVHRQTGGEVQVVAVDPVTGALTGTSTASVLPDGTIGGSFDVVVAPDGKFVYFGVRGVAQDAFAARGVAVFAANAVTGALTRVQHQPTHAGYPRDLATSQDGKLLFVASANEDGPGSDAGAVVDAGMPAAAGGGGNVTVFAVAADGRLTQVGGPVATGANRTAALVLP